MMLMRILKKLNIISL